MSSSPKWSTSSELSVDPAAETVAPRVKPSWGLSAVLATSVHVPMKPPAPVKPPATACAGLKGWVLAISHDVTLVRGR